jgi:hypothetical protein
MAKKTRRKRNTISQNVKASTSSSISSDQIVKKKSSLSTGEIIEQQSTQYKYLFVEIRRIGILAAAIILVLIILSFILG